MIKATELKPGHVIAEGNNRLVVLVVRPWEGALDIRCAILNTAGHTRALTVCKDAMIEIEPPQLTPAQQRADELLALLRRGVEWYKSNVSAITEHPWKHDAQRLLDEIDPPAPPTLAEVLNALVDTEPYIDALATGTLKQTADIINRARRAGIIK